jgi:hypothetical protein
MPQRRSDWHERIKAVEREFACVRIAVSRLSEAASHDPRVLGETAKPRDILSAEGNLSGTYLIRMFAEFETAIRSFWKMIRPNARPTTEVLVNSVGARRGIPADLIRSAHQVRRSRNQLVHLRDEAAEVLGVRDARGHLARFLARLPEMWQG